MEQDVEKPFHLIRRIHELFGAKEAFGADEYVAVPFDFHRLYLPPA